MTAIILMDEPQKKRSFLTSQEPSLIVAFPALANDRHLLCERRLVWYVYTP